MMYWAIWTGALWGYEKTILGSSSCVTYKKNIHVIILSLLCCRQNYVIHVLDHVIKRLQGLYSPSYWCRNPHYKTETVIRFIMVIPIHIR